LQVVPGLQSATAGRFIQEKNFATEAERKKLVEALLEVYNGATALAVMQVTPFSYPYVAGSTSVHPGYVFLPCTPLFLELIIFVCSWRSAVWSVFIINWNWEWDLTSAQLKSKYAELATLGGILRKITPWSDAGVYNVSFCQTWSVGSGSDGASLQNESDLYEPDWRKLHVPRQLLPCLTLNLNLTEKAYFGNNYAGLLKIKKKYDPKGLLDCFRCGTQRFDVFSFMCSL